MISSKSYERSYGRRQDDELRRIAGVYTLFYGGLDDKQVQEILAGLFEDSTGAYKEATDWISTRRSEVQGNMLAVVRTAGRCATEMASMQSKSGDHVARARAVHGSKVHQTQHMMEQLRDDNFGRGLAISESNSFADREKYIASKFNEAPVTICDLCFAWDSGSIDFGAIFYHPNKDTTKPWRKFVRSKFVNLAM